MYMEIEFAYDVKWASYKGNKSRMSHIDVNDGSIMASGIQPRRQWRHSYTVTCVIGE